MGCDKLATYAEKMAKYQREALINLQRTLRLSFGASLCADEKMQTWRGRIRWLPQPYEQLPLQGPYLNLLSTCDNLGSRQSSYMEIIFESFLKMLFYHFKRNVRPF